MNPEHFQTTLKQLHNFLMSLLGPGTLIIVTRQCLRYWHDWAWDYYPAGACISSQQAPWEKKSSGYIRETKRVSAVSSISEVIA